MANFVISSSSSVSSVSSSSSSIDSSSSSSSLVYCLSPNCSGAACAYFSNWTIYGANDFNTDNGRIHVVFNYVGSSQQIELYSGMMVSDLVAIGSASSAGVINFVERNQSGMFGYTIWDGTPVSYFTYAVLDCESSSSYSSLSSSSMSLSSEGYSLSSMSSSGGYSVSSSSSSESSHSFSSTSSLSSSSSSSHCCYLYECIIDGGEHFSGWYINGVHESVAMGCKLYVAFDFQSPYYQQVRIYRDDNYSLLVAIGNGSIASPLISLTQVNSSGISGSVLWDGIYLVDAKGILDCYASSSSSFSSSSSSTSSELYSNSSWSSTSSSESENNFSSSSSSTSQSSSSSSIGTSSSSSVGTSSTSSSESVLNFSSSSSSISSMGTSSSSSESEGNTSSSSLGYSSSSSSSLGYTTSSSESEENFSSSSSSSWSSFSTSSSSSSSSSSEGYSLSSESSSFSSLSSSSESEGNTSSSSLSSSSSSSSSSWMYSTSSSSSLSSSSSSSSSYLDYSGSRTVPFNFEVQAIHPIWCILPYRDIIYAGTGNVGTVLRSRDGYGWEEAYRVEDSHVTSLMIDGNYLYIGTSPAGKIYRVNLLNRSISLLDTLGGNVKGIVICLNKIYAVTSDPSQVYGFDPVSLTWNAVYQPYAPVTDVMAVDNKIYISMESPHVIVFDGQKWNIIKPSGSNDNIASLSQIKNGNVFSHTLLSNLESIAETDRVLVSRTGEQLLISDLSEEDRLALFPAYPSLGVSCIEADGNTLIMGSQNTSRVYSSFLDGSQPIKTIFDTDGTGVHAIVNLELGTNLAAIDSKLYLIRAGEITVQEPVTDEEIVVPPMEDQTETVVTILYPNGGEEIQIGEITGITWRSVKGVNDAVKLELLKGEEVDTVITSRTSNTGLYQWLFPTTLDPGEDYRIRITWLTADTANEEDVDVSDGNFSLVYFSTSTTTKTTTVRPQGTPDLTQIYAIPILDLGGEDSISCLSLDRYSGRIFIGTYTGRIILAHSSTLNAYFTGERSIYAEVRDGFGNISNTATIDFFYALYKKIAEVNHDKEIVRWKFTEPLSAVMADSLTGIFISPILHVKEDLGFWKRLMWQEIKPTDTDIIICVRSADSIDDLYALDWEYCFSSNANDHRYGAGSFIVRDLMEVDIKGQYIQFRVLMSSKSKFITPSVANIVISYSTKFAVYFYTTKFLMENDSNIQRGLLVANVTEPINTEIKFGIAGKQTANWNDYEVIEPDKFFDLDNYENIKVGIKMIAYDDHIPEVCEFALMMGGEYNLNKMDETL